MNKNTHSRSGPSKVAVVAKVKKFHKEKAYPGKSGKGLSLKGVKKYSEEPKNTAKAKGKPKDFNSYIDQTNKDDKGKTDWNELKSQMKNLREQRKKIKKHTNYDIYKEAKKLWETLRLQSCTPDEKEELCAKIMNLIKGNVKMIVRSHDMARIVQWLLKLGSDSVREQIFSEISEEVVNLSKNKYTKHAIKSLLQHCPQSIKKSVVSKCSGNIYSMTCNKVSAPLVEEMFKIAGPFERASMVKEFYGGIASDITLESAPVKDEVTAALLIKSSKFLNTLIDKGHCLQMNLVHSVLYDYLQKCDSNSKTEIINNLKSHFQVLLSSKDGVKLFSMILWESTAKEKKQIVKEIKTEIRKIAVGEHSSMALLLLMDSVDDTVLIKKALISGILENLESIVTDEHGRKVIIYLMVHRDSKYFHPKDIEWLSQLDTSPNIKKGSEQKIKEIQEVLLAPLSEKIAANPNFWFSNSSMAMVTLSIVKTLKGEQRAAAFLSIVDYIVDVKSVIIENNESIPAVEHPGIHMVLKKIILNDKTIEEESETFSKILVAKLDGSTIERWILSNRGCFTLVALLETNLSSVVNKLKKKLSKFSTVLNSQSNKGSKILNKCLDGA